MIKLLFQNQNTLDTNLCIILLFEGLNVDLFRGRDVQELKINFFMYFILQCYTRNQTA